MKTTLFKFCTKILNGNVLSRRIYLILIVVSAGIFTAQTFGSDSKTKTIKMFGHSPLVCVAEEMNLPAPYRRIESLLSNVYEDHIQALVTVDSSAGIQSINFEPTQFSDEFITEIADALLGTHYYPEQQYFEFIKALNYANNKQLPLSRGNSPKTVSADRINDPSIGWFLGSMLTKQIIPLKLSWEYQLLLQNRFILLVEPIDREDKYIEPELGMNMGSFYQVKVIEDLKGNFNDGEVIQLSYSRTFLAGSNIDMEIGKQYVVLLLTKSNHQNYGDLYLVRGLSTQGRAIYTVNTDTIFDPEGILFPEHTTFSITTFKSRIGSIMPTKTLGE